MHIVVITEQPHDEDHRVGVLPGYRQHTDRLLCGERIAVCSLLHYNCYCNLPPDDRLDDWTWWIGKVAVEYVKQTRPALVVAVIDGHTDGLTLCHYRSFLEHCYGFGIPVVQIWLDLATGPQFEAAEGLSDLVTKHIGIAGKRLPGKPAKPDRYLGLWSPADPAYFYDQHWKDVAVTFNALRGRRRDRIRIHEILSATDLPIVISGGRTEGTRTTVSDYARLHRRSKISINSNQFEHAPQVKGRVMEIVASNAMLLELKNPAMGDFFEDGVEYVSFEYGDLVDKIRYYMTHDAECERISLAGYRRYMNNYTVRHFWKTVFREVLG